MSDMKRLTGFKLAGIDSRGANISFVLESEGERRDGFTATDEVFGGLVRFALEVDEQLRRRRTGVRPPSVKEPDLLFTKDIELVIDITGESALLRARTGQGRTIQIELSEALLSRLQERVPPILAELRRRKGRAAH